MSQILNCIGESGLSSESIEENIRGECKAHLILKPGESSWIIKTLFQGTVKTNFQCRYFQKWRKRLAGDKQEDAALPENVLVENNCKKTLLKQ